MQVSLVATTSPKDVLTRLIETRAALQNAHSAGHPAARRLEAHIRWAGETTARLGFVLEPADLARLVLGPGFATLTNLSAASPEAVTNTLLDIERDGRRADLDRAIASLEAEIQRWGQAGVLTVFDTNVFIYADKLRDLDVAKLLDVRGENITIVLPILVIDELDQLKRSGDKQVRFRAGYASAVLNDVLSWGDPLHGRLRDRDTLGQLANGDSPRGFVDFAVLLDPPGHVRLSIADDEIVDRAATIQRAAARSVRVVTYDNGMAIRARAAGLLVRHIKQSESVPE